MLTRTDRFHTFWGDRCFFYDCFGARIRVHLESLVLAIAVMGCEEQARRIANVPILVACSLRRELGTVQK
jgi:hypothetical protein